MEQTSIIDNLHKISYSRMIFGTISVIALWRYFTKFLGLSKEMIEEISVNAKIGNLQVNDAYMDFSDLTFRVGGVILFLFVLTSNEIKISKNFSRNPYDYSMTFFWTTGLLVLLLSTQFLEFRSRSQVWMIIGGCASAGAILVLDELKGASEALWRSLRKPKEITHTWSTLSWKESTTLLVIVFYLIMLLFPALLPAYSVSLIPLLDNTVIITSFFLTLILTYSLVDILDEGSSPKDQDRKVSNAALIIAMPFILFLILRLIYLVNTNEDWQPNYDFMREASGIPVTNWPWQIDSTYDSRWLAYRAVVINSARVTFLSIVLCTMLGIFIGISRLSNNRLASILATAYVELFRNLPLAILLFFVSNQIRNWAPPVSEEVFILDMILLTKEGHWIPGISPVNVLIAIAVIGATKAFTTYLDRDGVDDSDEAVVRRVVIWCLASVVAFGVIASNLNTPELIKPKLDSPAGWYVLEGTGFSVSNPFVYMVVGLTLFTAAVVAEIVRGSVQSLPKGQVEAALSLGLSPFQRLRLVILPQALRSMVPLLNSQYMNVWKNSSLAIIVGFSDIFNVVTVWMNNVGKLVPLFILLLITYQIGSLMISAFMNAYNYRVTKVKI